MKVGWRYGRREDRREGREIDAATERRRGHLIVEGQSTQGTRRADQVHFDFMVRNAGPAAISGPESWIEDEYGRIVSGTAGGASATLAPNGSPAAGPAVNADGAAHNY